MSRSKWQLPAFLASLKRGGLSMRSVESYRYDLVPFITWCKREGLGEPAAVTSTSVARYQQALYEARNRSAGRTNGQPLSFTTQSKRLQAVRRYFQWWSGLESGWEACPEQSRGDPTPLLILPKNGRALPPAWLTAEETERVMNAVNLSQKLGFRHRAMLELLYATGMLTTELTALRLLDLNLSAETVTVQGMRRRRIPIGPRAAFWLDQYLHNLRPHLVSGNDPRWVFMSNRGRRFNTSGVNDQVRRALVVAGLPTKRGGIWLFRHSMVRGMLDAGADPRVIQALLGHRELAGTQRYRKLAIGTLCQVHKRTHPSFDR